MLTFGKLGSANSKCTENFPGVCKPKSALLCFVLSFGFNLLSKTVFSICTLSIWEFVLRRNEGQPSHKLIWDRMIANIAGSLDLYCVSLSELYQQFNNYLFLHQARLRHRKYSSETVFSLLNIYPGLEGLEHSLLQILGIHMLNHMGF